MTEIFCTKKPIIGMVHLLPLPGSPLHENIQQVMTLARKDYHALKEGGVDGILIENFGDAPYYKERVKPHTISWMTTIILSLAPDLPFGVNVLRNDAESALAIAHATEGKFIRCNILTGAMVTDQGIIEGKASDILRYKNVLNVGIHIFADVLVKHGDPLVSQSIERAARDTAYRGLADALIVTGPETGEQPLIQDLKAVKEVVPDRFLFAGSGVTPENVESILEYADGCIVGKFFKKGKIKTPVEKEKVKTFMRKVEKLR